MKLTVGAQPRAPGWVATAIAITAANSRPIGIISAVRKNRLPGQSRTSIRCSKPTAAERTPETRPSAARTGAGRSRQVLRYGTGMGVLANAIGWASIAAIRPKVRQQAVARLRQYHIAGPQH